MTNSDIQEILDEYTQLPEELGHFAALGKFISSYADAEAATLLLAQRISGLRESKARIMFAGMRLGDVSDRLKAMLRLRHRQKTMRADVERCLTQLGFVDKRHPEFC